MIERISSSPLSCKALCISHKHSLGKAKNIAVKQNDSDKTVQNGWNINISEMWEKNYEEKYLIHPEFHFKKEKTEKMPNIEC